MHKAYTSHPVGSTPGGSPPGGGAGRRTVNDWEPAVYDDLPFHGRFSTLDCTVKCTVALDGPPRGPRGVPPQAAKNPGPPDDPVAFPPGCRLSCGSLPRWRWLGTG